MNENQQDINMEENGGEKKVDFSSCVMRRVRVFLLFLQPD